MRRVLLIGGLSAVLLAGCGTGASEQEVKEERRDAFADGREVGAVEGEVAAEKQSRARISQAREDGYWEGWEEGLEEGEASGYDVEEGELSPYPLKKDGTRSYEFEPEDLERAEEGLEDEALREYCEGAVSEAQELGCLSHVDPSEVP